MNLWAETEWKGIDQDMVTFQNARHIHKKKKKSFRENKNLKKTIYVKDLKERYPLFRGLPKWLLEKRMACVGWLIFLYAEPNVD